MVQATDKSDDVTLRNLLTKCIDFTAEIRRRWLTLSVITIVCILLGLAMSILKKPTYEAKLSFVVEEAQSGGMLAKYSSLMSQFGFNMAMGGEVTLSEDNLMELLKSRVIVKQALMQPIHPGDSVLSLADDFIRIKGWKEKWKGKSNADPGLQELQFPPMKTGAGLSRLQDSIMTQIHETLASDLLTIQKATSQSNIIEIYCRIEDPVFPKRICEEIISSISDFYTNNKTQKARETLRYVKYRSDSVERALASAELQLAKWEDSNRLVQKAEGFLKEVELRREVSILNIMYAEIIKNLEMSKMVLLDQTPVIQTIDVPVLPLEKKEWSSLVAMIVGMILGLMIGGSYIIIRKIVRDVLR
ncbi:MAG: hypothetical protein KDD36_06150 [Flavobacteriales bacterium]|nr:hypothetical protein [Flavobacteriales bacterium]